ncbi:MAG: glutamine-hydrolyzing carbamoyl-phosphate synthase small subunit [Ignavibacteriales bacterium]
MDAQLILEDGTVFEGKSLGLCRPAAGEVVFNTGMTGYQEVLTDPSYYGQIVVMTYPLVGNYGVDTLSCQSSGPQVRGFVVSEACAEPSHWRSEGSLAAYLAAHGVPGISGLDTRALTRHIRESGAMKGVIMPLGAGGCDTAEAIRMMGQIDLSKAVMEVTTPREYRIPGDGPRVVVVDYGAKNRILNMLTAAGCDLVVAPAWYGASDIMELRPGGIVLSNGPGDPEDLPEQVDTVERLLGRMPVFGICLGHQVLALAAGAATYKMKFGHRGSNHPVKDLGTGKAWVTSQNHGYAVDGNSLGGTGLEVAQVNLTDGTIEGLRHRSIPALGVQYHPEAGPGPRDSAYLFNEFVEMVHLYAGRGGRSHARAS